MIDEKIKKKLLKEISKNGIVYAACIKVGVDKSSYYRWKENDVRFKKLAKEAEKIGDENICDVAEIGLIQNIKKQDQRAIEFTLTHRSKKYKRKKETSTVVMVHKKDFIPPTQEKTLEDFLDMIDKPTQLNKIDPYENKGTPIIIDDEGNAKIGSQADNNTTINQPPGSANDDKSK